MPRGTPPRVLDEKVENGGAPTESICRPDDGRLMYRRTGAPLDLFSPPLYRASARSSSSRSSFFLTSSSRRGRIVLAPRTPLSRSFRLDGSLGSAASDFV